MDITPRILEPCLPPPEDVHDKTYHYAPCPPDIHAQELGLPFLHVLMEPGNHFDDFWTNHVPKKLRERLHYQKGPEPVVGFGLYVTERPNWQALAMLTTFFTLASFVLAVIYSVVMKDVSSGFGIGSFGVAAFTLAMTLVLAVIMASLAQSS